MATKRIIITESTVHRLTGKPIEELSWEKCPTKGIYNGTPYEIKVIDGWTSCLTHGFEQMHVCKDPIINTDRQYRGRRIFRITRARRGERGEYKVYEYGYSVRDEGDNTPHPQIGRVDGPGGKRGPIVDFRKKGKGGSSGNSGSKSKKKK